MKTELMLRTARHAGTRVSVPFSSVTMKCRSVLNCGSLCLSFHSSTRWLSLVCNSCHPGAQLAGSWSCWCIGSASAMPAQAQGSADGPGAAEGAALRPMQCVLRLSEHELASDDKGLSAPRGADMPTRVMRARVTPPPTHSRVTRQPPTPRDHKPHPIYADASGAAAALASALRFALARALDLRASACSVKAFSRAFSPLSLWIASMSTRLFLYWLPFAAM